jgi:hypothetical protein
MNINMVCEFLMDSIMMKCSIRQGNKMCARAVYCYLIILPFIIYLSRFSFMYTAGRGMYTGYNLE